MVSNVFGQCPMTSVASRVVNLSELVTTFVTRSPSGTLTDRSALVANMLPPSQAPVVKQRPGVKGLALGQAPLAAGLKIAKAGPVRRNLSRGHLKSCVAIAPLVFQVQKDFLHMPRHTTVLHVREGTEQVSHVQSQCTPPRPLMFADIHIRTDGEVLLSCPFAAPSVAYLL